MKEAAAAVISAIAYILKQFVLSREDKAQARKKQNKELGEYNARQQRITDAKRAKGKQRQKPQPAYRPEVRYNPPGAERDHGHDLSL